MIARDHGGRWLRRPDAVVVSFRGSTLRVSTVSVVERFEKVKAEHDGEQDVHLMGPGSTGSTLCGMKAGGSVGGEVTCYRCHEFSRGDI